MTAKKSKAFSLIKLIRRVIIEWGDRSIIFISVVGNIEDNKSITYSSLSFLQEDDDIV